MKRYAAAVSHRLVTASRTGNPVLPSSPVVPCAWIKGHPRSLPPSLSRRKPGPILRSHPRHHRRMDPGLRRGSETEARTPLLTPQSMSAPSMNGGRALPSRDAVRGAAQGHPGRGASAFRPIHAPFYRPAPERDRSGLFIFGSGKSRCAPPRFRPPGPLTPRASIPISNLSATHRGHAENRPSFAGRLEGHGEAPWTTFLLDSGE